MRVERSRRADSSCISRSNAKIQIAILVQPSADFSDAPQPPFCTTDQESVGVGTPGRRLSVVTGSVGVGTPGRRLSVVTGSVLEGASELPPHAASVRTVAAIIARVRVMASKANPTSTYGNKSAACLLHIVEVVSAFVALAVVAPMGKRSAARFQLRERRQAHPSQTC